MQLQAREKQKSTMVQALGRRHQTHWDRRNSKIKKFRKHRGVLCDNKYIITWLSAWMIVFLQMREQWRRKQREIQERLGGREVWCGCLCAFTHAIALPRWQVNTTGLLIAHIASTMHCLSTMILPGCTLQLLASSFLWMYGLVYFSFSSLDSMLEKDSVSFYQLL